MAVVLTVSQVVNTNTVSKNLKLREKDHEVLFLAQMAVSQAGRERHIHGRTLYLEVEKVSSVLKVRNVPGNQFA